jgi:hypothetical protein
LWRREFDDLDKALIFGPARHSDLNLAGRQQARKFVSPFDQDQRRFVEKFFQAKPVRLFFRIQAVQVNMVNADGISVLVNESKGRTTDLFRVRRAATFYNAFRQRGFPSAEIAGQHDYSSFWQKCGELAAQILGFLA